MSAEVKPGYKLTAVGVIPEDWDVSTMGEICIKIQDGTQFSPKSGGKDYLYVTSKNIRFGYLDISSAFFIDREQHQSIYRRCDVKKSDLLLTKDGANTGNAALNSLDEEFSLLSSIAFFRFHESKHIAGYFLQQFLAPAGQRRMQDAMAGNAITRLTLGKINKLKFPVPPTKAEQEVIAEALSDADALIESLEQLITKKRQIKQGAMQELLTGKKRLPGFSGEWEVKSLVEISITSKGSQLHGSESTQDGKYPHLNGGIAPSGYAEKSNTPANTIAISEGGNSCGYVQLMTAPYWCGGHCYSIIPKCINNGFLYHALKSQQTALMGLRVGSGLPNVQKTALLQFKLCYPSNGAEQKAIATVLSDMDTEIDELEIKLDKAGQIKQGMMHNLLTGKIRLL